jgi:hypothetical protein
MRERVERQGVGKGKAGEGINRPRGYLHRLDQLRSNIVFLLKLPGGCYRARVMEKFCWVWKGGRCIYIPKKVDKQGRRFGFVKFRDVKDAMELLRSISDIWIGSFKLRVNRSKFRKNQQLSVDAPQPVVLRKESKLIQNDKTFKGALVDAGRREGGLVTSTEEPRPRQQVVWEVEVEEEVLARLGGAYVGYLVENKEAALIQNQLWMGGFQNLNICSMGFMKILISSDKVGEVKEVVESVGWWCSLFERVFLWSPGLVSNQRVVWLRCYGV